MLATEDNSADTVTGNVLMAERKYTSVDRPVVKKVAGTRTRAEIMLARHHEGETIKTPVTGLPRNGLYKAALGSDTSLPLKKRGNDFKSCHPHRNSLLISNDSAYNYSYKPRFTEEVSDAAALRSVKSVSEDVEGKAVQNKSDMRFLYCAETWNAEDDDAENIENNFVSKPYLKHSPIQYCPPAEYSYDCSALTMLQYSCRNHQRDKCYREQQKRLREIADEVHETYEPSYKNSDESVICIEEKPPVMNILSNDSLENGRLFAVCNEYECMIQTDDKGVFGLQSSEKHGSGDASPSPSQVSVTSGKIRWTAANSEIKNDYTNDLRSDGQQKKAIELDASYCKKIITESAQLFFTIKQYPLDVIPEDTLSETIGLLKTTISQLRRLNDVKRFISVCSSSSSLSSVERLSVCDEPLLTSDSSHDNCAGNMNLSKSVHMKRDSFVALKNKWMQQISEDVSSMKTSVSDRKEEHGENMHKEFHQFEEGKSSDKGVTATQLACTSKDADKQEKLGSDAQLSNTFTFILGMNSTNDKTKSESSTEEPEKVRAERQLEDGKSESSGGNSDKFPSCVSQLHDCLCELKNCISDSINHLEKSLYLQRYRREINSHSKGTAEVEECKESHNNEENAYNKKSKTTRECDCIITRCKYCEEHTKDQEKFDCESKTAMFNVGELPAEGCLESFIPCVANTVSQRTNRCTEKGKYMVSCLREDSANNLDSRCRVCVRLKPKFNQVGEKSAEERCEECCKEPSYKDVWPDCVQRQKTVSELDEYWKTLPELEYWRNVANNTQTVSNVFSNYKATDILEITNNHRGSDVHFNFESNTSKELPTSEVSEIGHLRNTEHIEEDSSLHATSRKKQIHLSLNLSCTSTRKISAIDEHTETDSLTDINSETSKLVNTLEKYPSVSNKRRVIYNKILTWVEKTLNEVEKNRNIAGSVASTNKRSRALTATTSTRGGKVGNLAVSNKGTLLPAASSRVNANCDRKTTKTPSTLLELQLKELLTLVKGPTVQDVMTDEDKEAGDHLKLATGESCEQNSPLCAIDVARSKSFPKPGYVSRQKIGCSLPRVRKSDTCSPFHKKIGTDKEYELPSNPPKNKKRFGMVQLRPKKCEYSIEKTETDAITLYKRSSRSLINSKLKFQRQNSNATGKKGTKGAHKLLSYDGSQKSETTIDGNSSGCCSHEANETKEKSDGACEPTVLVTPKDTSTHTDPSDNSCGQNHMTYGGRSKSVTDTDNADQVPAFTNETCQVESESEKLCQGDSGQASGNSCSCDVDKCLVHGIHSACDGNDIESCSEREAQGKKDPVKISMSEQEEGENKISEDNDRFAQETVLQMETNDSTRRKEMASALVCVRLAGVTFVGTNGEMGSYNEDILTDAGSQYGCSTMERTKYLKLVEQSDGRDITLGSEITFAMSEKGKKANDHERLGIINRKGGREGSTLMGSNMEGLKVNEMETITRLKIMESKIIGAMSSHVLKRIQDYLKKKPLKVRNENVIGELDSRTKGHQNTRTHSKNVLQINSISERCVNNRCDMKEKMEKKKEESMESVNRNESEDEKSMSGMVKSTYTSRSFKQTSSQTSYTLFSEFSKPLTLDKNLIYPREVDESMPCSKEQFYITVGHVPSDDSLCYLTLNEKDAEVCSPVGGHLMSVHAMTDSFYTSSQTPVLDYDMTDTFGSEIDKIAKTSSFVAVSLKSSPCVTEPFKTPSCMMDKSELPLPVTELLKTPPCIVKPEASAIPISKDCMVCKSTQTIQSRDNSGTYKGSLSSKRYVKINDSDNDNSDHWSDTEEYPRYFHSKERMNPESFTKETSESELFMLGLLEKSDTIQYTDELEKLTKEEYLCGTDGESDIEDGVVGHLCVEEDNSTVGNASIQTIQKRIIPLAGSGSNVFIDLHSTSCLDMPCSIMSESLKKNYVEISASQSCSGVSLSMVTTSKALNISKPITFTIQNDSDSVVMCIEKVKGNSCLYGTDSSYSDNEITDENSNCTEKHSQFDRCILKHTSNEDENTSASEVSRDSEPVEVQMNWDEHVQLYPRLDPSVISPIRERYREDEGLVVHDLVSPESMKRILSVLSYSKRSEVNVLMPIGFEGDLSNASSSKVGSVSDMVDVFPVCNYNNTTAAEFSNTFCDTSYASNDYQTSVGYSTEDILECTNRIQQNVMRPSSCPPHDLLAENDDLEKKWEDYRGTISLPVILPQRPLDEIGPSDHEGSSKSRLCWRISQGMLCLSKESEQSSTDVTSSVDMLQDPNSSPKKHYTEESDAKLTLPHFTYSVKIYVCAILILIILYCMHIVDCVDGCDDSCFFS